MKRFYGALLALYGILTILILVSAAFYAYWRLAGSGKRQPVAYNHRKHIEAGMECPTCHTGIADGLAHARLPTIDICLTCHASDDNPKTQPIRDFAAKNQPIPWQRVYQVPNHVFFSHRRHVGAAKLDCAVCHGDMPKKETPVARQAVSISMSRCINCHRRSGVSVDCMACHR